MNSSMGEKKDLNHERKEEDINTTFVDHEKSKEAADRILKSPLKFQKTLEQGFTEDETGKVVLKDAPKMEVF